VFSARHRQLGVIYVVTTLPVVAVVGALLPPGHESYIRGYVYLASGIYTTPALVVTWRAYQRVEYRQRWRWGLWFGGLVLTYTTGLGMLGGLATDSGALNPTGGPMVAAITFLFMTVVMGVVRAKSGRRALSVDLAEWAMSLLVVTAPAVLLWGDDILSSDHAWFALPAAMATIGTLSGLYWTVALMVRLRPGQWPIELSVVKIGVTLLVVGVVNGVAQVVQGLSGFDLPAAPLLVLQAACMSMLLLIPLFLPMRLSPSGLSRLPPQAQVRGAGLAPLVTLAGLPMLLLATLVERERTEWAPVFSLVVVALLVLLAVLRHLAGIYETRRLYALVEKASAERRDLLARVIQQMSNDRHTVAAQLHEQAMSAYATFASFMTARSHADTGSPDAMSGASRMLRDDLAKQAESLRQLMLAIRPMAMERSPSDSLGPPIQAYLDSLYGDAPTPALHVAVDEDLVLDWITETILSRIVQEAIHNIWRHSSASRITVDIRATNGQVEVRVGDDGSGFDPNANLFESGIAAMRSFAEFTNGSFHVESTPGDGTTIVARLGEPSRLRSQAPAPGRHLHLVPSERPSPART
jgi:signal transduction histidine kinase